MGNSATENKQQDDFTSIQEGMSFAELFNDEQLNVANVGDVVQGTIIGLTDNFAVIDIGDKSESEIPLSEFRSEGEEIEVKVGDVFDVFVEKREADRANWCDRYQVGVSDAELTYIGFDIFGKT